MYINNLILVKYALTSLLYYSLKNIYIVFDFAALAAFDCAALNDVR